MTRVRVRFAPSPTGYLHVGNARTALYNWLFARHEKGDFVLRIEDTDKERSKPEYEKALLEDLKWMGLDWDEGPDIGGPLEPYRQSERGKLYRDHLELLIEQNLAYRCYCTPEELKERREKALAAGKPPKYDNRCRDLSLQQTESYQQEKRLYVWRFKVPENRVVSFEDLIRGPVEFHCETIGDFVLFKADGGPTFHFSVVVDDSLMGITHVIRGEDHLSNTPKHILLYESFKSEIPHFAHLPLILGSDRAPLSKRHGVTSVREYHEKDMIPAALANYLALLGWSPGNDEEIFSVEELIQKFSLKRVNKSAAVFDVTKFEWVLTQHMKQKTPKEILDHSKKFLASKKLVEEPLKKEQEEILLRAIEVIKPGLGRYDEIPGKVSLFLKDEIDIDAGTEEGKETLGELQKPNVDQLLGRLIGQLKKMPELNMDELKAGYKALQKELGLKGKSFFLPIRAAITGQLHGPELNEVIPVLGKERLIKRIEGTLNRYCKN